MLRTALLTTGLILLSLSAAVAQSGGSLGYVPSAPQAGPPDESGSGWGRIEGTIGNSMTGRITGQEQTFLNEPGRFAATGWTRFPYQTGIQYGVDGQGFLWYRSPVTGRIEYYGTRETRYFNQGR